MIDRMIDIDGWVDPARVDTVSTATNSEDLFELATQNEKHNPGCLAKIRRTIDSGVSATIRNERGETPLMHAVHDAMGGADGHCYACSPEAATVLIEKGADVNARDNDGRSVLMHTTDVEMAQMPIDNGADVNAKDFEGHSVLHNAATAKYLYHITKTLLDNGANPCAQNKNGNTPLMELLENFPNFGDPYDRDDMYVKAVALLAA